MKRAIRLVFVLILSLSLCGCGKITVKLYADKAPVLDLDALTELRESDPAKAKEEYDGNIYRCTGKIEFVKEEGNTVYYYLGYLKHDPVFDMYISTYHILIPMNKNSQDVFSMGDTVTFAGELQFDETLPELRNAIVIEKAE